MPVLYYIAASGETYWRPTAARTLRGAECIATRLYGRNTRRQVGCPRDDAPALRVAIGSDVCVIDCRAVSREHAAWRLV